MAVIRRKLMKLRQVFTLIMIFVMGMCFSGCGKTDKGGGCTLSVISSYGGCGVGGQDLGSGSFTEAFTVYGGDKLYEWDDGHWNSEKQPHYGYDPEAIISIIEVADNGVTIQVDGEETTLAYNTEKAVESMNVVYDGINYSYRIFFKKD